MQIRQANGRIQLIRNQSNPESGRRQQVVLASWPESIMPSLRNLTGLTDEEQEQLRAFKAWRAQVIKQQQSTEALAAIATELRRFRKELPELPPLMPIDTGPIWRLLDGLKQALSSSRTYDQPHQE
jgi:hypothetical protein